MDKKEQVYQWLQENGIPYRVIEHPALHTIDEMNRINLEQYGRVCKNLFLRDEKGRRHYLVVIRQEKTTDLKALGLQLGTRLSFASEERLGKCLNLTQGSVTPLGVLFDQERQVEILIDEDFAGEPSVGVHPCDNTASVFLRFEDLLQLLCGHGNAVTLMKMRINQGGKMDEPAAIEN